MITSLLFSMIEISNKIVETLSGALGIWYIIILNAFGVIAIISKTTEFQLKTKKAIFSVAILSAFCWVAYFLVQGDFASMFACLITALDIVIFMCRDKYKWANSKIWVVLFVSLQLILGIISYKVWHDLFAIIGGTIIVICYSLKSKKAYRILSAFGLACWLANSISKMYIIALINDAFGCVSAIVSILRFYVFNKNKKEIED